MQIFLIVVHVIACLFLIAVILLQAGRGGGLSDMMGGAQTQSILGTETNTFMKRMTEVFAVVFILTSLAMGIISTHKGKSLMEQRRRMPLPAASDKTLPNSTAHEAKPAVIPPPAVVPPSTEPIPATVATDAKPSAEGNAK
ncbi:MAG: preprotein translocase subunit SecG [Candidatus Omnitrophica bacterium CG1_02_46_14]|nr:MAG: preprotein translocase subunit SecG [Candidatus Omnitrophica bacterium CG1_02_46_14]